MPPQNSASQSRRFAPRGKLQSLTLFLAGGLAGYAVSAWSDAPEALVPAAQGAQADAVPADADPLSVREQLNRDLRDLAVNRSLDDLPAYLARVEELRERYRGWTEAELRLASAAARSVQWYRSNDRTITVERSQAPVERLLREALDAVRTERANLLLYEWHARNLLGSALLGLGKRDDAFEQYKVVIDMAEEEMLRDDPFGLLGRHGEKRFMQARQREFREARISALGIGTREQLATLTISSWHDPELIRLRARQLRQVDTVLKRTREYYRLVGAAMRTQRDQLPEDSEDRAALDRAIQRFEAQLEEKVRRNRRSLYEMTEPIIREQDAQNPFKQQLPQEFAVRDEAPPIPAEE